MLAGFERPTHGRIWIDDTVVNTVAPKARSNPLVASQALPCPPLPWRDALLAGGERELLPERMLYFVLTATTVASLVLAFWQLRSLESGWASFVELVGRIVS